MNEGSRVLRSCAICGMSFVTITDGGRCHACALIAEEAARVVEDEEAWQSRPDYPTWAPTDLGKPTTFEDAFSSIFDQAYDILVERQIDYGPENIRKQGIFGVYARIAYDKLSRLGNLIVGNIESGEVTSWFKDEQGESVEDTLIDVMNYAAIMLALRRGWWGLPLKADAGD